MITGMSGCERFIRARVSSPEIPAYSRQAESGNKARFRAHPAHRARWIRLSLHIPLALRKSMWGLRKIYLVVSPEYFVCHIANRCRDSELFLVLEGGVVPAGRRGAGGLARSGSEFFERTSLVEEKFKIVLADHDGSDPSGSSKPLARHYRTIMFEFPQIGESFYHQKTYLSETHRPQGRSLSRQTKRN